MDLPHAFVRHVRERALLPRGARVLVACSGGGDSLALLRLIVAGREALGLDAVVVAHLDHALRPGSAADRSQVEAWAAELGTSCVGDRREVVAAPGESPEEAARRVRLTFLADAAHTRGATHVVTGHHADDQAETVLQRVLRGTGIAGLAGIPESRALAAGVLLVRPLLAFRRAELRGWLAGEGIEPLEDPTNVAGNERARLRTRALPVLAECTGRDPVPLLVRLAANAAAEREAAAPRDVADAFLTRSEEFIEVAAGFELLPRAWRIDALRRHAPALRGGASLSHAETLRLAEALAGGETADVRGLVIDTSNGRAWIAALAPAREPPSPTPVACPGRTALWDDIVVEIAIETASSAVFLRRLRDARLEIADADALAGALTAGVRDDGERLQPLGAARPARLGHVLQRRGVPAGERERIPIVRDVHGVVWVPGVALAERVRVTDATRRVATLSLTRG